MNALYAGDGAVVWSRNVASDTGTKVPYWGFSSSPLVVNDLVIAAAAGQLVAYDLATGDRRWFGAAGRDGYSSPHLVTIDGVAQILLMCNAGTTSVAPADGKVLREHPWKGFPIVRPAVTADGDVLPELGLHPDVLPKIADLLIDASELTQLIVTTHSDILVDAMSEQPETILVCEKHDGQTMINRLQKEKLQIWLDKNRLGELWTRGEIGGTRW